MTLLDLVKTDSSHPLTLIWDYGSTGNNGNLLSHTTNTGTRTFTQFFGYDAASRLRMAVEKATVSANLNSVSTTCNSITAGTWPTGETCLRFGYDSFGNGWNEESRNANRLRFQGHNEYLIGSTVSNRIKDLEYDSAGNLRQLEPADPLSPVANYDGERRIYELGTRTTSSPTAPVTPTAQYYYNGEGQRVERVVSGVTTYYVYGLDGAVAQEYTDGTVTASGRQSLIADHLGSTRLVLDGPTLQAVAHYDYEPDGALINRTGEGYSTVPGPSPFLFTGKERDAETGLDYFGARYMSAAQGRFTSPDPVAGSTFNPQSLNMYAYVWNNPLRNTDPTGMIVSWEDSAKKCDSNGLNCTTDLQRRYESRIKSLQESQDKKQRAKGAALAATYEKLQNAKETLHVIREGGDNSGELTYRGDPGNLYVEMKGSGAGYGEMPDVQKVAHEFKHGEQFLDGLLGFTNITGKWRGYRDDLVDEANAFMAGFMAESAGGDQTKFIQGLGRAAQWGVQEVVKKLDASDSPYRGRPTQQIPISTIPPSVYAVPRSK